MVGAESGEAEFGVLVDVPLADFEEAPAGGEAGQALHQEFPGQRIEHEVDPASAGGLHDFIAERERARIQHVSDAELA